MSHMSSKHMSADAADRFEENLEGEDFGSLDNWETELGMKILKIEKKMVAPAVGVANQPVIDMLAKKLVTYNAALQFLNESPKAAAQVGSQGGLQAVISFITKQAVEDAARAETRKYSNMLIKHLPGYKLNAAAKLGGLVIAGAGGAAGAAAAAAVAPAGGALFAYGP